MRANRLVRRGETGGLVVPGFGGFPTFDAGDAVAEDIVFQAVCVEETDTGQTAAEERHHGIVRPAVQRDLKNGANGFNERVVRGGATAIDKERDAVLGKGGLDEVLIWLETANQNRDFAEAQALIEKLADTASDGIDFVRAVRGLDELNPRGVVRGRGSVEKEIGFEPRGRKWRSGLRTGEEAGRRLRCPLLKARKKGAGRPTRSGGISPCRPEWREGWLRAGWRDP